MPRFNLAYVVILARIVIYISGHHGCFWYRVKFEEEEDFWVELKCDQIFKILYWNTLSTVNVQAPVRNFVCDLGVES
jgi:hypothetical protein